jgi:hypothetical protein
MISCLSCSQMSLLLIFGLLKLGVLLFSHLRKLYLHASAALARLLTPALVLLMKVSWAFPYPLMPYSHLYLTQPVSWF